MPNNEEPQNRGLWMAFDHVVDDGKVQVHARTGIRPPDAPNRLVVHGGGIASQIVQWAKAMERLMTEEHYPKIPANNPKHTPVSYTHLTLPTKRIV